MDKYAKLDEEQPPEYSETARPPGQQPPYYSAAPPVVSPQAPVYPAPEGGYVIPGQPGASPVVGQPQVIYVQAPIIPEEEAPDHLVKAILVTVCCCLPLGIVAILKSTECRSARMRGDRANAVLHGREAKKYACIGFGIGTALFVFALALYGVVIALTLSGGQHGYN